VLDLEKIYNSVKRKGEEKRNKRTNERQRQRRFSFTTFHRIKSKTKDKLTSLWKHSPEQKRQLECKIKWDPI
jgi:hypothetical protein